jgi:dTDP-4-dehydrorhamnose reductase
MKVAVIGANGQLGSDLVRTKPQGVELISLTHRDIEISNLNSVMETFKSLKTDAVINTAAFHKTDLCEDKPKEAFKVNSVGLKYLAEAANTYGFILVHISTDYVFDGKKGELKEPYYESDLPNPLNVYGISKLSGEFLVKNYLERYYIVRVASLFGKAGASGKGGNFVYTILNRAKTKQPLKIVDDIYMSPTYTFDAAKEIWKLLLDKRDFGIYHITNSGFCSWFEFAREILKIAHINTDIQSVSHKEFKTKAKRPLWSPLASEKGVNLPHWRDALERFIKELI